MGRWPAARPASAHFIGVGGVAMSGIAILLAELGTRVSGSDASVYPPASEMLAAAGIAVRTPFDAAHLDPAAELVVVGNAISRGNVELERALDDGLPIASMPELIERILVPGRSPTVVAGTHGKTTTSSLLAFLHDAAGRDPSFVVGGLVGSLGRGARAGAGPDLVLEGDEYDSAFFDKGPKFLHYWPRIGVLGAVEFDHADIYDDIEAVERVFSLFVRLVPASGRLVYDADCPRATRLAGRAHCPTVGFGLGAGADLMALSRRDDALGQTFTAALRGGSRVDVRFALPGPHNAKNALAALLAAEAAGLPIEQSAPLVGRFEPPRRRLERIVDRDDVVAWDDFAHHPSAIALTLETLRALVPEGGRLVACLEPRSNTMVRRLSQQPLIEALLLADRVLVAPVDRPGRFTDEERLDVAALVAELAARDVDADGPLAPDEILARLVSERRRGDRIVIMSNGAFGGLAHKLADAVGDL